MPRKNNGQYDAHFIKEDLGYKKKKDAPVHLIPRGRPAPPRPENQAKPEGNKPTSKEN